MSRVRLLEIIVRNFKNVDYGQVNLGNTKNFESSILGMYGQNGSGKTALIDAMDLFKVLAQGQPVPRRFSNFIKIDKDYAELTYRFEIADNQDSNQMTYTVRLANTDDLSMQGNTISANHVVSKKVVILWEKLTCKAGSSYTKTVFDTQTDQQTIFLPKYRLEELMGNDSTTDLLVEKKMTEENSQSFLFSRQVMKRFRDYTHDLESKLLEQLVEYAYKRLFVIGTANSGLISLHMLPLAISYQSSQQEAVGTIGIKLNEFNEIPADLFDILKKAIDNMNVVLYQLVPGLKIGVISLGQALNEMGQVIERVQIVSEKNSKKIPLIYESEGIKKIISILNLLIGVYNSSSVTVVIDELDAGIFEYLLGELLSILQKNGKGQLIFTSHNLRPLETLARDSIYFTTTNSENRYIRFKHIKKTNNLRDSYYRDILLGGQEELVYDTTNNAKIAFAFKKAGELVHD